MEIGLWVSFAVLTVFTLVCALGFLLDRSAGSGPPKSPEE
jgi:hypothetical protein